MNSSLLKARPAPLQFSVLSQYLAAAALIAVALFVRLYASTITPLWYDEVYGVLLAQEAPARVLLLAGRDNHPPFYYLILHYWILMFGSNPVTVRSLGILADIGMLLLCLKLMRMAAKPCAMWITALLLPLLSSSVENSVQARMYPILGLCLMGATVALVCWAKAPHRKRYSILYVLLMATALYTHYFATLCLLTHWIFWWRAVGDQARVISVQTWIGINVAIVLLYLPWIPFLLEQIASRPDFSWIGPITWQSVSTLVWQLTGRSDIAQSLSGWGGWLTVFIVICAVAVVWKDQGKLRLNGLVAGYFFVPAITLLLVAVFKPVFVLRYFYFAAIGIPMILGLALGMYWDRHRMLVSAGLAIIILIEIDGVLEYSNPNVNTARPDILADYIQARSLSTDVIVVDDLLEYLPFVYYNRTPIHPQIYVGSYAHKIGGFPDRSGWTLVALPQSSSFHDDESLLKLETNRVWWVTEKTTVEDISLVSKQWKKVETVDGGPIEARLFMRE